MVRPNLVAAVALANEDHVIALAVIDQPADLGDAAKGEDLRLLLAPVRPACRLDPLLRHTEGESDVFRGADRARSVH
jgi:hypothetical protein